MEKKAVDVSRGKTGAAYDRTVYACVVDDAWVTVEVPKPQTAKL